MAQVRINPLEGPHTATVVEIVVQPNDSAQLRNILLQHLPEMLRLFIKKNGEYGAGDASSGTALGQKGQFADIWRKIGKLKTAIWDGNEHKLVSEGVNEILMDLIGHCFLTLHMRQLEIEQEYGLDQSSPEEKLNDFSSRELMAVLVARGDVDISKPWSMDQVKQQASKGDKIAQATLDTPDEVPPGSVDREDESFGVDPGPGADGWG